MKRITANKLVILFFIGYAIFAAVVLMKRRREDKLLLQGKNKVTLGWITDFGYQAGGASGSAMYSVKIDGEKYSGPIKSARFCTHLSIKDKNRIRNRKYPIVYLPDNPSINRIVLSESDYEKYELPYPDSISEFLDLYFNCKD